MTKICSECLRPVSDDGVSGWLRYRCHGCLKDFGFFSSDVDDKLICPYCGHEQPSINKQTKKQETAPTATERGTTKGKKWQ